MHVVKHKNINCACKGKKGLIQWIEPLVIIQHNEKKPIYSASINTNFFSQIKKITMKTFSLSLYLCVCVCVCVLVKIKYNVEVKSSPQYKKLAQHQVTKYGWKA